jgi:hypothetical protein
MSNPYQPEKNSPGRAVIPVTALAAVVLTVVLFNCFYEKIGAEKAVCVAAFAAFVVTALIGMCFKPILGE